MVTLGNLILHYTAFVGAGTTGICLVFSDAIVRQVLAIICIIKGFGDEAQHTCL